MADVQHARGQDAPLAARPSARPHGEEIVIARNGRPLARLVAIAERKPRRLGFWARAGPVCARTSTTRFPPGHPEALRRAATTEAAARHPRPAVGGDGRARAARRAARSRTRTMRLGERRDASGRSRSSGRAVARGPGGSREPPCEEPASSRSRSPSSTPSRPAACRSIHGDPFDRMLDRAGPDRGTDARDGRCRAREPTTCRRSLSRAPERRPDGGSPAALARHRGLVLGLRRAPSGGSGVVELAEQRGVAAGAADQVVGAAVRQQPALARAEVDRLRVVGDERERRLLGVGRVAVGDRSCRSARGRAARSTFRCSDCSGTAG